MSWTLYKDLLAGASSLDIGNSTTYFDQAYLRYLNFKTPEGATNNVGVVLKMRDLATGRLILKQGTGATGVGFIISGGTTSSINCAFNMFTADVENGSTTDYYSVSQTMVTATGLYGISVSGIGTYANLAKYQIAVNGYTAIDVAVDGKCTFPYQLISSLATGTSPFSITSTTVNTNLNADLWDGYQFSDYLDQAVKQASSPQFEKVSVNHIGEKTASHTVVFDNDVTVTSGKKLLFAAA